MYPSMYGVCATRSPRCDDNSPDRDPPLSQPCLLRRPKRVTNIGNIFCGEMLGLIYPGVLIKYSAACYAINVSSRWPCVAPPLRNAPSMYIYRHERQHDCRLSFSPLWLHFSGSGSSSSVFLDVRSQSAPGYKLKIRPHSSLLDPLLVTPHLVRLNPIPTINFCSREHREGKTERSIIDSSHPIA